MFLSAWICCHIKHALSIVYIANVAQPLIFVTSVAEYVSTEDVKSELNLYLSSCPKIDVITFSGAGEPTLQFWAWARLSGISKRVFGYPVAVITNGTLLNIPSVRDGLHEADIVMTSFDALDEDIFFSVNRPHKDIEFRI